MKKRNRGKKSPVPTESIIPDFEAGMKIRDIASKHGMTALTVRYRLNQWKPGCVARRMRHQRYQAMVDQFAASRRRLDERAEQQRRIVDDVKSGMSCRDVGRKYGVSDSYVAWLAQRAGAPVRQAGRQRDAAWLAMRERGVPVRDIAAKAGKPTSTVRDGIRRARSLTERVAS